MVILVIKVALMAITFAIINLHIHYLILVDYYTIHLKINDYYQYYLPLAKFNNDPIKITKLKINLITMLD